MTSRWQNNQYADNALVDAFFIVCISTNNHEVVIAFVTKVLKMIFARFFSKFKDIFIFCGEK